MKKHTTLLLSGAMLSGLLLSGLGLAQEESIQPEEELTERIEVRGKKTPTYYYRAMRRAEIDLYDKVNLQIEDPKYKVSCGIEANVGSNIKKKACLPNFVRDRLAFETQKAMDTGANPPTLEYVESMLGDEQQEALNAVAKVIEGNPELIELLIKFHTSVAEYENSKAQELAER